jgi:Mn2+/Fe2+ NRAMP family transporter
MAAEDQEKRVDEVQPGMKVETTEGDLGEQDVRPAHITHVTKDQQGEVKSIEVEKGILFRKKLEVPADRVQQVKSKAPTDAGEDVATVDVSEAELEGLHSIHTKQTLASEDQKPQKGLLDQVEQQIPTEQGLREKEGGVHVQRSEHSFWHIIGPGLLSGTSGNDSSAVTAYAIDGASAGYSHLWLMLLSTPLYQAVQFACAKIGRVSQKGLAQLLREHYGRPVAGIAALLLIITNVALIAADLVAIGSGLELITSLNWVWFVIPSAILLWYLTVFGNFEGFKKIFLTMSFVFITYILTAFFAHANWGAVLVNTFVPHLDWKFGAISSAVALLGATISPYSMFWQVQGEIEEKRVGSLKAQLRDVLIDVGSGAISGNLVAYFIIVTTSATLFAHQKTITTAADAARALEPLAGPLAYDLFAVGLVGSGIVAIPVLLASTSYTVTGAFGWPAGLSKRP